MHFLQKIYCFEKIFEALLLKHRFPLIIIWDITYNCNFKCIYCPYWNKQEEELKLQDITKIIKKFAYCGTKFIILSGGEPLLRDDLPEIINFCKKMGMYVSINSNGSLIKKRIKEIRAIDSIKLSLDGPEQINDAIRNNGSYQNVLNSIQTCKKEGIEVNLSTVVSGYNVKYIQYLLNLAKELDLGISFQPVKNGRFDNEAKDIIKSMPKDEDYKKAMSLLIKEKAAKNKHIKNSLSGLKYFYNWPEQKIIPCFATLISCYVSPNGYVSVCDWRKDCDKYLISQTDNFKKLFYKISAPRACDSCLNSSTVDLNMLGQLKIDSIVEVLRKLKFNKKNNQES